MIKDASSVTLHLPPFTNNVSTDARTDQYATLSLVSLHWSMGIG